MKLLLRKRPSRSSAEQIERRVPRCDRVVIEARRQAQINKSEHKRNGPGDFFPNNFQFAQHMAGTVLPSPP
jgi:hypothetical protein